MKLILLSGGSGQRLWPLSNDSRSKQFLKVLKGKNGMESMVQRVYGQIEAVGLSDSTIIATCEEQVEILQNQLGDNVPLVVEPSRRDTYPAIALATVYLYSQMKVDSNEIVVVLPVDPYVDLSYFNKIKELGLLLTRYEFELGLLGVKPTYPSEKYGYIVPRGQFDHSDALIVNHFKEKPGEQEARLLIEQNALWNCGVFAFRSGFIIEMLKNKGLPTQYESLVENYELFPKTSFDYEVVENAREIAVLPYQGEWKDIGSWNTLTEEMDSSIMGNGIISEECLNSHVINELDLPVAVLGLSDVIVAVSPDGILVSNKESSSRIKEFNNHFYKRPMYEEKRWGWQRILETISLSNGDEVVTKRVCLHEGKKLSYHKHLKREENWTIIQGLGEFVLDGEVSEIRPGDVLSIPRGALHAIRAITQLELIEIQIGSEISLQDVHRQTLIWDEI